MNRPRSNGEVRVSSSMEIYSNGSDSRPKVLYANKPNVRVLSNVRMKDNVEPKNEKRLKACLTKVTSTSKREVPMNPDEIVDLKLTFINLLLEKKYEEAKEMCQKILQQQPGNEVAKEFLPTIDDMIAMKKLNADLSSSSDESSDSDESGNTTLSDSDFHT